jgi:hypothetical protein
MELENWLARATRGLASESVARVRSEILEHYQLAREAALTGGVASDQAAAVALNALGDAREANRQYRHVLLTAREARMLRESSWEGLVICFRPWLKWLMLSAPVVAAAAAIALLFSGMEAGRDVLIMAIGMSPLLMAPQLPIYTPARGRIFRWVKWLAITGVFALILGSETLKYSWLLISCLWPMGWSEWMRYSIRRKLPVATWPRHLYL